MITNNECLLYNANVIQLTSESVAMNTCEVALLYACFFISDGLKLEKTSLFSLLLLRGEYNSIISLLDTVESLRLDLVLVVDSCDLKQIINIIHYTCVCMQCVHTCVYVCAHACVCNVILCMYRLCQTKCPSICITFRFAKLFTKCTTHTVWNTVLLYKSLKFQWCFLAGGNNLEQKEQDEYCMFTNTLQNFLKAVVPVVVIITTCLFPQLLTFNTITCFCFQVH